MPNGRAGVSPLEVAGQAVVQRGVRGAQRRREDDVVRSLLGNPELGGMIEEDAKDWILRNPGGPARGMRTYFQYLDATQGGAIMNWADVYGTMKAGGTEAVLQRFPRQGPQIMDFFRKIQALQPRPAKPPKETLGDVIRRARQNPQFMELIRTGKQWNQLTAEERLVAAEALTGRTTGDAVRRAMNIFGTPTFFEQLLGEGAAAGAGPARLGGPTPPPGAGGAGQRELQGILQQLGIK